MRVIFLILWALVLLFPQLIIRFSVFDVQFGFSLLTLLIIYAGFNYSFVFGMMGVIAISFLVETFSFVPHGYLIVSSLILFVVIQLMSEGIFTEAYITKSSWVFLFSLIAQCLTRFALEPSGVFIGSGLFWISSVIQSLIDGLISLPLFIVLDRTYFKWIKLFSRQRAQFTAADLFQVRSKQRRYL